MPLPFERSEYEGRIARTKAAMAKAGVDVLLVVDPANMNYLTGYNAWSFYTPQTVVIAEGLDEPLCIVRGMDARGARETTFLSPKSIIGFPDHYVQSLERHAMDYVAKMLEERGLANKRTGLELDTFYFSPTAAERLKMHMPNATFSDANLLVNWVRAVKSPAEIHVMTQAARIMEKTMRVAIDMIEPGVRQCDVAAAIYQAQVSGLPEFGGDYTAFVPMLPTGRGTSTPHLTWTDEPFKTGEATILELAAARHRYHCPLARTLFLGKAPQVMLDTEAVVQEGLQAALDSVKPGVTCEEVEAAWRKSIAKSGLVKESRIGYSIGCNYPPDWGEHTMSLRPNDKTVLQENMTLHCIPGIWMDDWGMEISESFRVTAKGHETLAKFPRELVVKN
jgi:ectoine utilization protein EutD